MQQIKKSPFLYSIIITLWLSGLCLIWYSTAQGIRVLPTGDPTYVPSQGIAIAARCFLVFNGLILSYVWLNGIKDITYVLFYFCCRRRFVRMYDKIKQTNIDGANEKVILLYCTCNDFDGHSLEMSMKQDYQNFETIILDDSKSEEYKAMVDEFALKHGVEVIRRDDRIGFKAGNINNYLQKVLVEQGKSYDYAVILDSDEIIPPDFVKECLRYFYTFDNIGLVQANHVSTRNRNFFMKLFHIGVNSHWTTYQITKHKYGFSCMLGHGAMIKRECYDAVGGFPHLVAEDLCLSIEARNHGYVVAFAPNIICQEEYPVDYLAFKKRHSKWTQGNFEFMKAYTGKVIKSKMRWFEKIDIFLSTYSLPLTALTFLHLVSCITLLPLLHLKLHLVFPPWILVPMIIFFISPLLNDVFTWMFRLNPFRMIVYFAFVIVLYGSMLYITLISSLLGLFGRKAKFIVTPKTSQKRGLLAAIRIQLPELIFTTILIMLALLCSSSIWPVVMLVYSGYFSVFLVFFANKAYEHEKVKNIDNLTTQKTLNFNKAYLDVKKEQGLTG